LGGILEKTLAHWFCVDGCCVDKAVSNRVDNVVYKTQVCGASGTKKRVVVSREISCSMKERAHFNIEEPTVVVFAATAQVQSAVDVVSQTVFDINTTIGR